jgi:subtilisin family serine protease/pimeloyl-ACP methyl ester carboxylesterase
LLADEHAPSIPAMASRKRGASSSRSGTERGRGSGATRQPRKRAAAAAARPTDGEQRTHLLYIHGIGWQEPLEELQRMWDLALFGRELGDNDPFARAMARWSGLLHPETRGQVIGKRSAGVDDGRFDVEQVLAEVGVDGDAEARELADGLLARFGVRRPGGPGKRALPLPGFLRKPLARVFLKAFVGDTAAYFFDPAMKARIRATLEDLLPAGDEEVVLVSHSMGTVIAFEVLHARAKAGRPVNVRQFVTLGSPLGITEVQDFLDAPLVVPEGVHQWLNFADPFDPVALDKGLANEFEARRTESGSVRIVDRLIVNERTTRGNPHASLGYLADPKVRTAIAQALRIDAMGRFLVARDVAAELGDSEHRQPVLIEVLQPGYDAFGGAKVTSDCVELTLPQRIARTAAAIEAIVAEGGEDAVAAARIDPLRHFVAAHLLPHELMEVTRQHRELLVYSVWKSSSKKKLVRSTASALQVDAAWNSYASSGRGVAWAVLDTGVQGDHPHFARHDTIAAVWDCTKQGPPQRIEPAKAKDKDGHGTHVCGILAGEEPAPAADTKPHRGMAPHAKLHVYKVLDDQGAGEDAWIIKALDHIAARNAASSSPSIHGLNLSLGGPFDSTVYGCGFSPLCQELRRLWRDGVVVVVASGNEGKLEIETSDGEVELNSPMSIGDPANLEECIAVGSVHGKRPHLYGVSGFSSRGPTADGRLKPDVVAPGERIESCNSDWRPRGKAAAAAPAGDKLYRAESGTSMAAPAVSGLLAAYLSARTEFQGRPDEVKARLLRTCTDLGRDRYHQGHGLPNLMKLLLET